jgi:hypothetical protein
MQPARWSFVDGTPSIKSKQYIGQHATGKNRNLLPDSRRAFRGY